MILLQPAVEAAQVHDAAGLKLEGGLRTFQQERIDEQRSSLIGSLVQVLRVNLARRASRVRIFETGRVYWRDPASAGSDSSVAGVAQPQRIAGLAYGSAQALQWLFANAAGHPVFVDTVSAFKCRRVLPWLSAIHTLKVNQLEAQALTGLRADDGAACGAVAAWLHEHFCYLNDREGSPVSAECNGW